MNICEGDWCSAGRTMGDSAGPLNDLRHETFPALRKDVYYLVKGRGSTCFDPERCDCSFT
jgi:hypothetical protein